MTFRGMQVVKRAEMWLVLTALLTLSTLVLVTGVTWKRVHEVNIFNFAFEPVDLTVRQGDVVRWRVLSGSHSTTSNTGVWDSAEMEAGQVFEHRFDQAGVYAYYCKPHSFMQARIAVEATRFESLFVYWGAVGATAVLLAALVSRRRRRARRGRERSTR